MNKKRLSLLALACTMLYSSHAKADDHFLKDEKYRSDVHSQFVKRKAESQNKTEALFSVFNENLTTEEREALEFLYAYMPISDLADYNGNYYLEQVRGALKSRAYFDWGKTIPDDVFRHFVLVYRINNENLDNAREVFFEELKDRVKGMTMEEAALEVNHWCHEKVNYRATDGRTSSPLSVVRTSWGRCGEESTFTTMALRSVGIPARQCYTPRWAHTDDNHAWVEVWIDGKWHYIGACEPEPELDVAWFTAPAKRAMMVHTNVFGKYNGSEEKNKEASLYSTINLLSNYTNTRKSEIKVVGKNGKPVKDATVKFNVYNYAEFYPVATSTTSKDGKASISTGKGDVFVWATDGNSYGYVISKSDSPELTIVLDKTPGKAYTETIVINPPAPQKIKELSPEKIASNSDRLAHEDSIRNAYMNTFINEQAARNLAKNLNLNADSTWLYLNMSQGNWNEISKFISQKKDSPYLFSFLASITAKDLRDTPSAYLIEHFDLTEQKGIIENTPKDLIVPYVYSPRIANELIRPWRASLQKKMKEAYPNEDRPTVDQIVAYIKGNLILNNSENYYLCPISPQGVAELGITDAQSRDILFVAICRSEGIAARLEPSTSRPQVYTNGQWLDINLGDAAIAEYPKANVTFNNDVSNIVKPGYSTHYTLAKYKDGDFVTLDFSEDTALQSLPGTVSVDAGYYRLTVGSRANDGSVTVDTQYFTLNEGDNKSIDIVLPKTEGRIQVQGIVDMNNKVTLANGTQKSLKDLSKGKGLILCFSDPDKEPTKHILQDIPNQQKDIEEWNGGVLFMIPDDKVSKAFNANVFPNLPKQSLWGTDNNRALLNATADALQIEFSNNFPLIIYLSDNGGILFSSEGYKIGIPENILKTIKAEEATLKK